MRTFFFALLFAVAAHPALALDSAPYVALADIDLTHLLPPPPEPHSDRQAHDLGLVAARQAFRSPVETERAVADSEVSIFRFADVMGPDFTREKLPGMTAFFAKVARDTSVFTAAAKDCWERPRPFVVNPALHPPRMMAEGVANRPGTKLPARPADAASPCLPPPAGLPEYSYSFPSGHSTFAVMTAILLSEMVPEKRRALFARAWDYGDNRVVGGVHFPTDVEAGRIAATAIAAVMLRNPLFRADLGTAKAELRAALGLSSQLSSQN